MRAKLTLLLFLGLTGVSLGQSSATKPPSSPPPAATSAPAGSATVDGSGRPVTADEAFQTRVRSLEEKVTDLKEKVFRSRARLMLLQETVLGGDLNAGARAVVFHKNEMGPSFVLEQVTYALDGAPVFTRSDANGELSKRAEFEVFNGRLLPGQHQLVVKVTYRGNGYGLFSYLEGYKFNVQSTHTFNAEPGKVTTVKVIGFEKADVTADLKDKPQIRYDVEIARDASLKSSGLDGSVAPVARPAGP